MNYDPRWFRYNISFMSDTFDRLKVVDISIKYNSLLIIQSTSEGWDSSPIMIVKGVRGP